MAVSCLLFCRPCCAATSLSEISGEWRGGYVLERQSLGPACTAIEWIEEKVGFIPVPGEPTELRGIWNRTARWVWKEPSLAKAKSCRWNATQDFEGSTSATSRQALTATLNLTSRTIALRLRFMDCQDPMCDVLLAQSGLPQLDAQTAPSQNLVLRCMANRLLAGDSDGTHPIELHRTAEIAEDLMGVTAFTDSLRAAINDGQLNAVAVHLARDSSLSKRDLPRLQQELSRQTGVVSFARVMTFDLHPDAGGRRVIAVIASESINEDYSTFNEYVFQEWDGNSWKLLEWLNE